MKVLVCGGRDFNNYDCVNSVLSKLHSDTPITTIISGRARGADRLGERWAEENAIILELYPADWDQFGRAAGAIRNQQMLTEGKPDLVVAFPGGRGTQDMVRKTRATKTPVIIFDVNALNPTSKRLTGMKIEGTKFTELPELQELANRA